jgi:hypothetical protein
MLKNKIIANFCIFFHLRSKEKKKEEKKRREKKVRRMIRGYRWIEKMNEDEKIKKNMEKSVWNEKRKKKMKERRRRRNKKRKEKVKERKKKKKNESHLL